MEWFKPLSPVVPVFLLITIGFLFAEWKKISLASLTEIMIYLAAPCLVFTSLIARPIFASDIAVIFAGAVGILSGVGLLTWLYSTLFHCRSPGFIVPVLFMNAGNMGIPLSHFAFGEPGLQRASLFFVIMSAFHYSLGVYILSGRGGWKEIFRLPLIYATLLGLSFNLGEIKVPAPIFQGLSLLGYSTIPLMLLSLGYRLHEIRSLRWGHALGGALIRIVGGLAAAYATVSLLGIEGINRQMILLYGGLPSAVVNFVLTEKYSQDPELAASIIFLTTLFSLASVPLLFWFIL
jgi:predicted permease